MKKDTQAIINKLRLRLHAKQPIYQADDEWRDISAAIAALELLVRKGWVK